MITGLFNKYCMGKIRTGVNETGWRDRRGLLLGWPKYIGDTDDPNYKLYIFWPPGTGLSVHLTVRVKDEIPCVDEDYYLVDD